MRTVETEITKMSTNELEAYIDLRYEAGALQAELEALEVAYANRVSEEDLHMTEDEPNVTEEICPDGGNLEIGLIEMYHRYLQPEGKRDRGMTKGETIQGMRANLEDAGFISRGLKDVSDSQVLEAAKDIYEYKRNLIQRYKFKNKLSNIPGNLWSKS